MPAVLPRGVLLPAGWLWYDARDGALRATCTLGGLCALGAAFGGVAAPLALFVAWSCWLMLATVSDG